MRERSIITGDMGLADQTVQETPPQGQLSALLQRDGG
jgi:hypothetical protein